MQNKEIAKLLKFTAALLELHDENQFKIRTYTNAVFHVDKSEEQLIDKTQSDLEALEGIGKGLAKSIVEMRESGSFSVLDELIKKTPEGILDMIDLKGIGPKKIKLLWKELGIESIDALYEACKNGDLSKVKGFGTKTQETILQNLEFLMHHRGMALFADAEALAEDLISKFKKEFQDARVEFTGQYRRKLDILDKVEFIMEVTDQKSVVAILEKEEDVEIDLIRSGPFTVRGRFPSIDLDLHIRLSNSDDFARNWMLSTGSGRHLFLANNDNSSLYQYLLGNSITDETQAYAAFQLPFIQPELREGILEANFTSETDVPELLLLSDLKGPVHNHSNYSDGKNSIRELANYCIEQGYEYLGLSDHSKSAFYANGLQEFRIKQQHDEIDQLNEELAPFKIFKGIESDILSDGSLDYDTDVLSSFDFIVASIHSNLNMDKEKATMRLIRAIENPYTTMLGHPTGRLQLRRKGYPIDHRKVIDACAANSVIIEINANPWRLDLDWRWVHYALEKSVILSINPDAHEVEGFDDMKYGVFVGRKGGLTKASTFNAWSLQQVESYLTKRKEVITA